MKNSNNEQKSEFLFDKENYKLLLLAISVIVVGFILMAGGGNDTPVATFNDEVFNFQRIRLAPTLVLIGFGIAIYSIFKKTK